MTSVAREFVLSDAAGAGPDLLRTLACTGNGALSWAGDGAARTRRRTWLDTFDWRLYRAGLILEQVVAGGQTQLVLTRRDGSMVAAERLAAGARPSWPGRVSSLPAGPLRAALQPVAGVRALAPVARVVSKLAELQALNGDSKTVARLTVDRMALTFPVRAPVPALLTLLPVRGYQAHADKLGRAIGRLPGVIAGRGSALDVALTAADGRRPGDVPGKPSALRLPPDMPATAAMTTILTTLLDAMEANVPGTVRDIDTEFLHDLRVAVRWTRSVLKLCGDALPPGLAGHYAPEFRWLGDLTTPTRDLDVFLLGYPAMAAGLVGATAAELTPFRDHLVSLRAAARRGLTAGLRSARFTRLAAGFRSSLLAVHPAGKHTVAALADAKIAAAHRRALRAGRRITSESASESLHDLRKRCKELRYLVEMFGSLHDPAERWQAVRELKALQDCLGEFQDAEVQQAEIRAFAAQMMTTRTAPAETLLAMGEIAASLAARQAAARAQFAGRFADFAGPASRGRMAALARTAVPASTAVPARPAAP